MVEEVSPGPYLEMFARDNRLGWDSWGNECLSVDLPLEAA
jgi:N6-adenosine-specific RNA methylase IME4